MILSHKHRVEPPPSPGGTAAGLDEQAAKGLRKRQRALARGKRGSRRRAKRQITLTKYQEHIANKRRDHLHKLSRQIVNRFGRIAVEDLNIKGLAGGKHAKQSTRPRGPNSSRCSTTKLLTLVASSSRSIHAAQVNKAHAGPCGQCGQVRR